MPKIIERRVFPKPLPKRKRVAAYARVSSSNDAMHHSLSAQISYYSSLIQSNPNWQFVGVYADEGKTGTNEDREQFQQLLADCRAGKIDLILVKSISRLSRNTLTVLKTVRELKLLGVDVYFEEQRIHSVSMEGEVMLSIIASFGQAESQSVSENQKWRIKKNFEEGKPWNATILGYRYQNGQYVIEPTEADIVRRVFAEYLAGKGCSAIANNLEADGIPTRHGGSWCKSTIAKMLRNYTYTGNLLLQKTFQEDYLSKRTCKNEGQLPMYHATETHEAIIDKHTFEAVQTEIAKRAKKYTSTGKNYIARYPFSGIIICANCGKNYRRKTTAGGIVWICSTFNSQGKAACASKQIPEEKLAEMTADIDFSKIECIFAENGNNIRIRLKDGTEITRHWLDRSRSESWTDKMKEQAKQKQSERSNRNG